MTAHDHNIKTVREFIVALEGGRRHAPLHVLAEKAQVSIGKLTLEAIRKSAPVAVAPTPCVRPSESAYANWPNIGWGVPGEGEC